MTEHGPMARARQLIDEHQKEFGELPHAARLVDSVGTLLGFLQLSATPHTRDIAYGPSDEECAVACMLVSNPQGAMRQDGDGWQKRVNDTIRALRDERNQLRAALKPQ